MNKQKVMGFLCVHDGIGSERRLENMKKIMLSVALLSLLCLGLVNAQESYNNVIAAGESSEVDLGYTDIQTHESLGVFISQILFSFNRFIDYGGETIFQEGENTLVDYELQVFQAGLIPVGTASVINSSYASTEEVEIRGTAPHVWTTYLVDVIEAQSLSGFEEIMTFADDEELVITTDFDGGEWLYWNLSGVSYSGGGVLMCDEIECPTIAEVDSYFGITASSLRYKVLSPGLDKAFIVCPQASCVEGDYRYFIETDKDYSTYEFDLAAISGFGVDSFETQSAIIVPAGNYDLYGLVS